MSTSKKKIALVASAVAMTLAASLAAATPATAAPQPPPGEGLTPQVERASQQAIPHLIALKKQDVRTLGSLALHDGGVHAGVTAPFSGLYCDTTDNGATGAEQAPLLGRWWSCSARPTTSTSRSTTSSPRGVTRTPPWSTCRTTPVSAGPPSCRAAPCWSPSPAAWSPRGVTAPSPVTATIALSTTIARPRRGRRCGRTSR